MPESLHFAADSTSRNRCLPYNQGPNATDSESTIRSASHVGNTILPHDSKHDGNRVFTDKEDNGDFIHNQDIEEDSVPVSNPWPTGLQITLTNIYDKLQCTLVLFFILTFREIRD